MWKFLWCFVVGHKPFRLRALFPALIAVRDIDGQPLLDIHICERCGGVFAWLSSGVDPHPRRWL